MVTLVVAFIVIGAIYASYRVQQRNSIIQKQITEIQQNLRAGIEVMSHDFRLVAYDPTGSDEFGIVNNTIQQATENVFWFTADLCEDGGAAKPAGAPCGPDSPFAGQPLDEDYRFQLMDTDGDGINDALTRTAGGTQAVIAENIDLLQFHYVRMDGLIYGGAPPGSEFPNIRAVIITMIGRASQPDFNYSNNIQYVNGINQNLPTYDGDNFRRRVLIKRIELRNAGLI